MLTSPCWRTLVFRPCISWGSDALTLDGLHSFLLCLDIVAVCHRFVYCVDPWKALTRDWLATHVLDMPDTWRQYYTAVRQLQRTAVKQLQQSAVDRLEEHVIMTSSSCCMRHTLMCRRTLFDFVARVAVSYDRYISFLKVRSPVLSVSLI